MSATAVTVPAGGLRFWQTTVGKKAIMAVTGFILFGFVVGHLLGNLQIYLPPEKINHYSATLKSMPALLWGARITLLIAVGLHIWSSFQLWLLQREARPVQYVKKVNDHSTYASRTMQWSGPIILAFLIFHLLHFTFGTVHPGGPFDEHNVYNNVVTGFQVWPVSLFYIIAMIMLCYHLYHGSVEHVPVARLQPSRLHALAAAFRESCRHLDCCRQHFHPGRGSGRLNQACLGSLIPWS